MTRICKKCLIGQEAENYLAFIEKNKALTPAHSKVSDAVYNRRIDSCEACDYLAGATCQACGCYVELRAMMKNGRCPYKKWEA